MTRPKRGRGRTTRGGMRPEGWVDRPGGQRHRRPSTPTEHPPLRDLLLLISGQLAELMPMTSGLPVPDRDGLAAAIETEFAKDKTLGTIVVVASELLDHAGLRALVEEQLGHERALAEPLLVELRGAVAYDTFCLLYTSPSPRDATLSRMPSSA